MTTPLTLYIDSNFHSPYAMSAYVCLREKDLPFAIELVNLREQQHHGQAYSAMSLTARVPTLLHAGFALSESSAIDEYLEDLFTPPRHARVLPENLRHRARARQIQAWLRSDLMPIREERPTTVIFQAPNPAPLSDAAQRAAAHLFQVADSLITDPAQGLFGDWCIADTELALMLKRLVANGDAVPDKLRRYVDTQWARASVQAWVNKVMA